MHAQGTKTAIEASIRAPGWTAGPAEDTCVAQTQALPIPGRGLTSGRGRTASSLPSLESR